MITMLSALFLPPLIGLAHALPILSLTLGDDVEADERARYDYTPPRDLGCEPWRGGVLVEQD